jgi:hypothetical protein
LLRSESLDIGSPELRSKVVRSEVDIIGTEFGTEMGHERLRRLLLTYFPRGQSQKPCTVQRFFITLNEEAFEWVRVG